MKTKAVAFLKATQLTGYELACSKCPIVLSFTHDRLAPLPQHRCNGKANTFDIVMELDSLVLDGGRIDEFWSKER